MKKYFLITAMVFWGACKAQSQIVPLSDNGIGKIPGAYYKDINNELSKYVGTWKFEEQATNSSLIIIIQKKTMFYNARNNIYEDLLVGEYKFVQNGVVVVNTLDNLINNHQIEFKYNISGLIFLDRHTEPIGNRRIQLYFNDPEREYLNRKIIVKHILAFNGAPEKIQLEWTGDMSIIPDDTSPTTLRVPEENYILVKQP